MNTLEFNFICSKCNAVRQYGCAENLRNRPGNLTPTLRCATCKTPTLHGFMCVQERTAAREVKVWDSMKHESREG
jgi:hypothetical protein